MGASKTLITFLKFSPKERGQAGHKGGPLPIESAFNKKSCWKCHKSLSLFVRTLPFVLCSCNRDWEMKGFAFVFKTSGGPVPS